MSGKIDLCFPERKAKRSNQEESTKKIKLTKSDIEKILLSLEELHEKVSRIKFLYLIAEDIESAYEIFETQNARGEDLTGADLLKKSFLLSREKDH